MHALRLDPESGLVPSPLTCVMDQRLGPYHWARLHAAGSKGPILGLEMSGETIEYAWEKVAAPGNFQRVTLFADCDSRTAPTTELKRRVWATLDKHRPGAVAIFAAPSNSISSVEDRVSPSREAYALRLM
jgi:hypothetical protein